MGNKENQHIDGGLAVEGNLTASGDANVRGNAVIGHNLIVEGWLLARNVKYPLIGFFMSREVLEELYPNPKEGWGAIVGGTLPGDFYIAHKGKWEPTGEKAGSPTIEAKDMTSVFTMTLEEMQGMDKERAGVLARYGSLSIMRYSVTDGAKTIGVLDLFGDSAGHCLTQRFTTRHLLKDDRFNADHSDANEVHTYSRTINVGENTGWTQWKEDTADMTVVDNLMHWLGLDKNADAREWYAGLSLYELLGFIRNFTGMKANDSKRAENLSEVVDALKLWTGLSTLDPGEWDKGTLIDMMNRGVWGGDSKTTLHKFIVKIVLKESAPNGDDITEPHWEVEELSGGAGGLVDAMNNAPENVIVTLVVKPSFDIEAYVPATVSRTTMQGGGVMVVGRSMGETYMVSIGNTAEDCTVDVMESGDY